MLEVTDRDDGSTISLSPGEIVELVLDENATTGYLWSIARQPEGLHLDDDGIHPPGDARPGAGGRHWFRFHVAGSTEGPLIAELRRPWETGGTAERTFQVVILTDDESSRSRSAAQAPAEDRDS